MSTHRQENDAPAEHPTPDNAALLKLIARLEALLPRPAESRNALLRVGPLELDLLARAAKRGDRAIDLLPCEFRLLEYMMRHKEQILTRAVLLQEVWNYKFVPRSNLVDVHMGRLRRKVDQPHDPPMIYNVRGMGFVLRVPALAQREQAFSPVSPKPNSPKRRCDVTKILAAVALAVLIASPAKAAAFRMGSEVLPPAGGALGRAGVLQPVRLVVDPPDTGSVIIECGAAPTQTGLEARVLPAAFATRTSPRPPRPRRERG